MSGRALVFGASGALGSEIAGKLMSIGSDVVRVSRSADVEPGWVSSAADSWTDALGAELFDQVVFAHGENTAGGIADVTADELARIIDANVLSIVRWVGDLRSSGLLAPNCRICIIGSVWANIARPKKIAYVVSKSAVSGLVRSLAIDLADDGIAVNAVLPGVIDTPMTRSFLSNESLEKLIAETPGRQLVSAPQIAEVCTWLVSPEAKGIVGQAIVVDNGWSISRYV